MLTGHLWRNVCSSSLTSFEFLLLLSSCKSLLYILDVNSLSGIWFANIFSHFVGCLFAFLCFSMHKSSQFWWSSSFLLLLLLLCFKCYILIHWGSQVAQWWRFHLSMQEMFDPWLGKILWRRAWQPTPVFLPGKSHRQKNLMGYSTWGSQRVGQDPATEQAHWYVKYLPNSISWFLTMSLRIPSNVFF